MADDPSMRAALRGGSIADKKAMMDEREAKKHASQEDPLLQNMQPFALRHTEMDAKKKMFDQKVQNHSTKMATNPFSGSFKKAAPKLTKDDPNYGKPVAGSKSERRGKNAARHINHEVVFLCDMIYQEGEQYPDGTAAITFGDLFQIYTRISNKLVGMLLRARKYGLIDFEGEMLYQRRDDDVPILLLRPIKEIRDELHKDQEFEVGVCHMTSQH